MALNATITRLSGDPQKDVKLLANHVFMLEEQLRYELRNLDVTNFNDLGLARYENGRLQIYTEAVEVQTEKLRVEFGKETEEIYAQISATAEGLQSEFVNEVAGVRSQLTVTAAELQAKFTDDIKGVRTEFATTAEGLQTRIESVEGNYTNISTTVNGIQTTVSSNATKIGNITTNINNQNTLLSLLQSQITQTDREISAIVTAVGWNGEVTAASIVAAINAAGSEVVISADHVQIVGNFVTFTDLAGTGNTIINGANIRAGEINAVNFVASGDMYSNVETMKGFLVSNGGGIIGRVGYGNLENSGAGNIDLSRRDQMYMATYEYTNGIAWFKPTVKILGAGGVSVETGGGSPVYIKGSSYLSLESDIEIILRDNVGAEWKFTNGGLFKNGIQVL